MQEAHHEQCIEIPSAKWLTGLILLIDKLPSQHLQNHHDEVIMIRIQPILVPDRIANPMCKARLHPESQKP